MQRLHLNQQKVVCKMNFGKEQTQLPKTTNQIKREHNNIQLKRKWSWKKDTRRHNESTIDTEKHRETQKDTKIHKYRHIHSLHEAALECTSMIHEPASKIIANKYLLNKNQHFVVRNLQRLGKKHLLC